MASNTNTGHQTAMEPEQEKQQNSDSSHTSAQEKENREYYSKIVERENIEGTMFTMITVAEAGSFLAIGDLS